MQPSGAIGVAPVASEAVRAVERVHMGTSNGGSGRHDVVVVGAGLAGLACAADLSARDLDVVVLEAGDGIGGRVRTDRQDGYQLDRGFQVLLTSYPQVRQRLDLAALDLRCFDPGATVVLDGARHQVRDPLRRPLAAPATLRAPIGSVAEKLRVLRWVLDVRRTDPTDLLRRPDRSTADRLAEVGFGDTMVERFWRPLLGGILLDPDLAVSRRPAEVILRMLATGAAGVPAAGIGAVAGQVAAGIPPGAIRLHSPVERIDGTTAVLAGGEAVLGRCLVVATDGPTAHRLLGAAVPDPGSRPVACCWLATTGTVGSDRLLLLDGTGRGPALNVAVLSEVAPTYAPPGRSLVAAAVPGPAADDPDLEAQVTEQVARWFDTTTADWQLLRTDRIAHGHPDQTPPFGPKQPVALGGGRFVCGDHRDTASTQGALFSGQRAARAVVRHLTGSTGG
jgi:phytoene dehydrogenase-like protein